LGGKMEVGGKVGTHLIGRRFAGGEFTSALTGGLLGGRTDFLLRHGRPWFSPSGDHGRRIGRAPGSDLEKVRCPSMPAPPAGQRGGGDGLVSRAWRAGAMRRENNHGAPNPGLNGRRQRRFPKTMMRRTARRVVVAGDRGKVSRRPGRNFVVTEGRWSECCSGLPSAPRSPRVTSTMENIADGRSPHVAMPLNCGSCGSFLALGWRPSFERGSLLSSRRLWSSIAWYFLNWRSTPA